MKKDWVDILAAAALGALVASALPPGSLTAAAPRELPAPPTPERPKVKTSRAPRAASAAGPTVNPDYLTLAQLTVQDGSNQFVASLRGLPHPTVQADAKSCVVIFPLRFTNYTFAVSTNAGGFTNAQRITGTRLDTNSVLVFVDLHGGTRPIQFFQLTETPK